MSAERCKHGMAVVSCSTCARPDAIRLTSPLNRRSGGGGITEVHRGFSIYYRPPPEREWSFRPAPDAPLQSYRSAFQARRAINELLDGTSESTPRRDSRATSIPKAARPQPAGSGTAWSDSDLEASITAFRRMLDAEDRGQSIIKREVVESLMKTTGRTKGSIEMRFQNISAVLHELGLPWIDGYKPLSHYPERLKQLIERGLPW